MCCLLRPVLLGPRAAIFFWWLFEPVRWGATFDTSSGPWWASCSSLDDLMYVLVFPGGIDTWTGCGSGSRSWST